MDATTRLGFDRQDTKILGLISTGHFLSHFYFLTLPPLFPFLKDAFEVGYTELGLMMTLTYAASALAQVPVGFLVDRIGARLVLTVGLALLAVGFGLVGMAPSFVVVIGLTMLAGLGHSVFHPADYAILNASMSPARIGRAFSVHTFAGHLGSAVAPAAMVALAAVSGWRMALVIAGASGLAVLLAMMTQWSTLRDDALPKPKKREKVSDGQAAPAGGLSLLLSRPMILFLLFFATLSMTSTGMQAFSVSALVTLHDMPVATASAALTAYLFCSAAGILVGGEIADRTKRHDIVAGIVFVLTAAFSLMLVWFDLPFASLVILMVIMGLGQGIIRPARDMMLRSAAPRGSAGKVFGFVSMGISVGSAVAPIPFGWLLDTGRAAWVFYLIAIFMAVALVTVVVPKDLPSGPSKGI
jgi:MFS family permease